MLLYTLPGVIIGMVAHELTHGAIALRLGDPSPRRDRRMTLDPRRNIDPIGLAALVIAGFGWSKPVRLDPMFLRDPTRRAVVAAGGPLANLAVAAAFGFALAVEVSASQLDVASLDILAGFTPARILFGLLLQGFLINLALAVFNALPLPGLDGYAVLRSLLFTRLPRLFLTLEAQRLPVYAAVALAVILLPQLTAGAINPFAAASTGVAALAYSHLVQPGVTPLFLGMPNIFTAFTA